METELGSSWDGILYELENGVVAPWRSGDDIGARLSGTLQVSGSGRGLSRGPWKRVKVLQVGNANTPVARRFTKRYSTKDTTDYTSLDPKQHKLQKGGAYRLHNVWNSQQILHGRGFAIPPQRQNAELAQHSGRNTTRFAVES